ncbi:unnamed protein product, partial [Brenthis ino]
MNLTGMVTNPKIHRRLHLSPNTSTDGHRPPPNDFHDNQSCASIGLDWNCFDLKPSAIFNKFPRVRLKMEIVEKGGGVGGGWYREGNIGSSGAYPARHLHPSK